MNTDLGLQELKHTSTIERSHSHHHLDVSSTCRRHLCVYLMPGWPKCLSLTTTPLSTLGRFCDPISAFDPGLTNSWRLLLDVESSRTTFGVSISPVDRWTVEEM